MCHYYHSYLAWLLNFIPMYTFIVFLFLGGGGGRAVQMVVWMVIFDEDRSGVLAVA